MSTCGRGRHRLFGRKRFKSVQRLSTLNGRLFCVGSFFIYSLNRIFFFILHSPRPLLSAYLFYSSPFLSFFHVFFLIRVADASLLRGVEEEEEERDRRRLVHYVDGGVATSDVGDRRRDIRLIDRAA